MTKTSDKRYRVYLNHIGFLCEVPKKVIVEDGSFAFFEVQDMNKTTRETLGEYENWETIFKGPLVRKKYPMGTYLEGDFSKLKKPGLYRVVLTAEAGRSYHFPIADGNYRNLIRMFLDFVHNWRSGSFENDFRTVTHLDDAIRSDTGKYVDVSGGWYDAGDLRKWMTMSVLPILGFFDVHDQLGLKWNYFSEEKVSDNDLITESIWGLQFIMKMQDKETGMIYEEVGAGGDGRKETGMTWWYENHSGCLADNSQNRFTDNIIESGDERIIRTSYNPIVQYTNLTILLRASQILKPFNPDFAERCLTSAEKVWHFTESRKKTDPFHTWTSVLSWRLCAGLWLYAKGWIDVSDLNGMVDELVANWDKSLGFWFMDTEKKDPYRGIIHSAQPIIALSQYLLKLKYNQKSSLIEEILENTWNSYIRPMLKTNPFGIMPYGVYSKKATERDTYHKFEKHWIFRYFMPEDSEQRINHGLGGHWTSWAHALALAGKALNEPHWMTAAWDQIYWLLGNNSHNSCLVTGVGYNNPMPHSRFFGTFPGGFSVGPRGSLDDKAVIDLDKRAEWSSTEYWLTPLSNMLMALANLLPREINKERKIGELKLNH